jgi:GNAT superfamily N-acetyltransferase
VIGAAGWQPRNLSMSDTVRIRPVQPADLERWRPLWDAYNAFYGRQGPTALPENITAATWSHFFDPAEPVFALVAEDGGELVGLVHYLYHRSTTRLNGVCYLQDLYTAPGRRGQGIGRRLIQAVCDVACVAGSSRVYWHTQHFNKQARQLYDQVASHENGGFIVYVKEL